MFGSGNVNKTGGVRKIGTAPIFFGGRPPSNRLPLPGRGRDVRRRGHPPDQTAFSTAGIIARTSAGPRQGSRYSGRPPVSQGRTAGGPATSAGPPDRHKRSAPVRFPGIPTAVRPIQSRLHQPLRSTAANYGGNRSGQARGCREGGGTFSDGDASLGSRRWSDRSRGRVPLRVLRGAARTAPARRPTPRPAPRHLRRVRGLVPDRRPVRGARGAARPPRLPPELSGFNSGAGRSGAPAVGRPGRFPDVFAPGAAPRDRHPGDRAGGGAEQADEAGDGSGVLRKDAGQAFFAERTVLPPGPGGLRRLPSGAAALRPGEDQERDQDRRRGQRPRRQRPLFVHRRSPHGGRTRPGRSPGEP